jgi:hypothetical protein
MTDPNIPTTDPIYFYYLPSPSTPSLAVIGTIVGYPVDMLYKQNVGGPEEGPYASSYETNFFNEPNDPADATIAYVEGPIISGVPLYLLVKDGVMGWFLFDLKALNWDGIDTIELVDFWLGKGAISHVSIYGPTPVPEPTTLLLFGSGLVALALVRRKFKGKD